MSVNISETICQATEIIAENLIRQVTFDRTISCRIIDDSQRDIGKYLVESESAQFYAYASGGQKYSNGNNVYVTIPQGNWDEQKFITGKKTSDNEAPVNYVDPYDRYIAITENMFDFDGNSTAPPGLIANGEQISLDVGKTKDGDFSGYTRMAIKAEFMCWLKELQVVRGNYGLKFTFNVKYGDNNNQSAVLERYFECSDMVGNPYQFESFFPQKKVFDISGIENIESVKIELFQDTGSFATIESNDIYGGMNPFKNIFVKDIYISFGYGAEEFDKDKLILLSKQPSVVDGKDYDLSVRWIHKFEDGIRAVDFTKDKLPCTLRYYEYTPGSASADQYSGVDWKNIEEYTNIPKKEVIKTLLASGWKDGEKDKNYQTFSLSDKIYRINGISLVKTEGKENEEEVYTNADFVAEIDESDKNKQTIIITCQDKIPEIDLKVNIEYQADEIKNKSFEDMICSISIDTKRLENRYKAILVSEGIDPVYSNIITYANDNVDNVSEETIIAMRALQIYCDDDSYGNYLLYDLGGRILDTGATRQVRDFKLYFSDSLDEVPSELEIWGEDLEKITWTIPAKNTMIKLVNTNGWTQKSDYYERIFEPGGTAPTVQYTIGSYYNQTYNNNIVECQIVKNGITYVTSKELTFGTMGTSGTDYTFVLDFVNDNYNALTISDQEALRFNCDLEQEKWVEETIEENEEEKNRWVYTISPEFNYDYSVIDYAIVGESNYQLEYKTEEKSIKIYSNSKPTEKVELQFRAIIDYKHQVLVRASLYDSLGNSIDIKDKEIEWSFTDSTYATSFNNGVKNEVELQLKNELEAVPTDNYTILKATLPKNDNNNDGWGNYALEAYLPIPIRSSADVKYISGATVIQYNALGQLNQYFQNPYALHIQGDNGIEDKDGVWEITSGEGANDVYKPRLEVNDDKKTRIRPLSTYIQNTNSKLCIWGKKSTANTTILWSQPLYVYQNRYPSSIVNKWDGTLVIDKENNAVMSAQVIAGKKEGDNSFTGVMMGTIGKPDKSSEDESVAPELTDGIFGYSEGRSAFAFQADGTAFIGLPDKGRLYFDGTQSTITSASYSAGQGMQLDFDNGKITIKDNEFSDFNTSYILEADKWVNNQQTILLAIEGKSFLTSDVKITLMLHQQYPGYQEEIDKINEELEKEELTEEERAKLETEKARYEEEKARFEAYQAGEITVVKVEADETVSGKYLATVTCVVTPTVDIEVNAHYIYTDRAILINVQEENTPFKIGDHFSVNWDGTLNATNGKFSGTIDATGGTIGGWEITNTSLKKGAVELDSSTGKISGAILTTGEFEVNSSGILTATGATMRSINVESGTFKSGIYLDGIFSLRKDETPKGELGIFSGNQIIDGESNDTIGIGIKFNNNGGQILASSAGAKMQFSSSQFYITGTDAGIKVNGDYAYIRFDRTEKRWYYKNGLNNSVEEPIGSGTTTAVFG